MGAQNSSTTIANSVNGAAIDTITPSGKAGAISNVILKNVTQVQ